ncbi:MAG: hypothetical protein CL610_24650 [Anaerolineaceae bacterium]|nr:hypothetical protein [Anaerolineaceae bacterium]
MQILRLAWDRLRVITAVIGDVQGRLIAMVFYYTLLVPFGVGARLFTDPLRRHTGSAWLERPPVDSSLDDARMQG